MAPLKHEIAQQSPFSSREEEATLNILRTADCLLHDLQRTTRGWGITVTQYNVLRILRGAHPQGLTCKAIGDRMITAVPDITRLLARLKAQKLIRQQRDGRDRRVVWTRISDKGLELLLAMDPVVQRAPVEMLEHLGEGGLDHLIRLLELARNRCGKPQEPQKPLSCDGSKESA